MEPFCSRTGLRKPDAAASVCLGFHGYGAKTYPSLLVIKALMCGRVAHSESCILHVCLTWTPTVLHLVLCYTNIAKLLAISIKF